MGDAPVLPGSPSKPSTEQGVVVGHQRSGSSISPRPAPPLTHVATDDPRPAARPQHLQDCYDPQRQSLALPIADMAQPQGPTRPGPYDMAAMATALPQPTYRHGQFPPRGQQRFSTAGPSPGLPFQLPMQQFGPQPILPHPLSGAAPYYLQQQQQHQQHHHPHVSQYYSGPMSPSQAQTNLARTPMGYYPNPLPMSHHQHPMAAPPEYYYAQAAHFQTAPGHGMPGGHQFMSPQYLSPTTSQPDPRLSQMQRVNQPLTVSALLPRDPSQGSRQSVVRGPPRKPRQSGHAIWIGNLPPQADLMSLVQHVCKEAGGLESLFLISKSNCAFANFRDEQSCAAAQQKIHDSKFQTVRLVSRLRKSAVEGTAGVSAPTGPAASTLHSGAAEDEDVAEDREPDSEKGTTEKETAETDAAEKESLEKEAASPAPAPTPAPPSPSASEARPTAAVDGPVPRKDRFFVLKSLTVEDLELSVRTGIWATQSHNEDTLNKAFESADNVYLIFSANKSGEYFGYARMISPINNDPAAAIEFAPKAHSTSDLDLPKAIPTEATEFAPKGRIIDDSARGTIFWEAETDDDENNSSDEAEAGQQETGPRETGQQQEPAEEVLIVSGSRPSSAAEDSSSAQSAADGIIVVGGGGIKAWGKPFRLEWLSTTKLPFYRTRGLRNPWNSNREVKIARDGTELEPSVGRRLIGLFNKTQSPAPPHGISGMAGGGAGIGGVGGAAGGIGGAGGGAGEIIPTMIPGFPPMRSPY